MARSGIRYEEVKDAAETLLSRGLSPTIQHIREVLGTGSNTTISAHLKHWQQRMAEAPRAILPPAIPETVMTALDTFWKIAVQHAEAAFDEQRAVAAKTVAAAEEARLSAVAEAQQAHSEAAEARHQWEILQTTARDLADRLLIEQERRATAETAITAAEHRVQTATATVAQIRAETEARVAQLETTLQQARTDLEQQRAEAQQRFAVERQRGEANEARLMQQMDRARQEYLAERQTFIAERQDWKNREVAAQKQQEASRQENMQLRTALAAAEGRQEVLMNEINQWQTRMQQIEARYLEAVRDTETVRGELKAARADRERLEQKLTVRETTPPEQTAPMAATEHNPGLELE